MKKIISMLRVPGIILPGVFALAAVILVACLASRPATTIPASDLSPLSLEGVERILILAPHCDDESLGSGGLIQAAEKAGIEVRVVIATNGDGFRFATSEKFHKVYPKPIDYIRMGELRQQESLAALEKLGVPAEQVIFLSYPDRGTPSLWETNWSASQPYTSPYIDSNRSPYHLTYNPSSVYSGEDYLADVSSIIRGYRPDMVIYPHAEDVHPDHWGLNVFARLALTEVTHLYPAYQPEEFTYLVHRPDYPVIKGLKPAGSLVPPPALYAIYPDWMSWPLSPQQIIVKGEAIASYKSQITLLRKLMVSFIRTNELFAPVQAADLPTVVAGEFLDPSTWQDSAGQPIFPVQLDPTGDVFSHKTVRGSDLKALYAARTLEGEVWACAQLHGKIVTEIPYILHLKSLTGSEILSYDAYTHAKKGQAKASSSGSYFCTRMSLESMKNPWAIYLAATVQSPDSLVPFDQTAWQVVYVQP